MAPIGRQRNTTNRTAPKGRVGFYGVRRPSRFKMRTKRQTVRGPSRFAVQQCAAGWYWNKSSGRCEKA